MKSRRWIRLIEGVTFVVMVSVIEALAAGAPKYRLVTEFDIGGTGTSFMSAANSRLYLPHDQHLIVIDENTGKTVGSIPTAPGHEHGSAIVPELERGFIAVETGSVVMFDSRSLATIKRIAIGDESGADPELILYDPDSKHVLAVGEQTTVLDSKTGTKIGEISLSSEPSAATLDGKGILYIALKSEGKIAAVSTKTGAARGEIRVEGCSQPTALAYDPADMRIFVGCSDRNEIVVVNPLSGKVITTITVAEQVRQLAYDRQDNALFVLSGKVIDVIRLGRSQKYLVADVIDTEESDGLMVFDPGNKRIYLNRTSGSKGLRVLVFAKR
jgi:DNA-binding beta-propeller fold protein YncE